MLKEKEKLGIEDTSGEILSPGFIHFQNRANCSSVSSKQLPGYPTHWETSTEDSLSRAKFS